MAKGSGTERRRFVRLDVSIPAQAKVPLPELSDEALVLKATIKNLSVEGAKVFIHALKKEDAAALLRMRRKCTLLFTLPGEEAQSVYPGEIVWVDLHADIAPITANLGISLKDLPAPDREHLARFLDGLSAKK